MHRTRSSAVRLIGVVAGLIAVVASCGGDERVVVFAASSLTDVFERLELEFEAAHPDVDVIVNVAGSSSLVAQLADGAPVDVLVTADQDTMATAVASTTMAGDPVVLARNELVIVVERGNPLAIGSLDDLSDDVVVVLAAPDVPAGAYSRAVLACAGVDVDPASLEQSVRSVAAKVALGEADAGLVYRTDVSDDLDAVELPDACQVTADYPIVVVVDAPAARRFVEFATGSAGADALSDEGFVLP
ncbi:MAG: molybdate ABC transporter substrate-binding protein [Ilumatobacteraceae bacterium]|nr:molybdate ABC transporter substrate-binding protein [Ilumatobacteraceae bacterium]